MGNENEWYEEKGYKFSGLFYTADDKCSCRRVLKIRNGESGLKRPDLMVIMMNPGGSKPIPDIKPYPSLEDQVYYPTIPDDTQWRVIRFMECNGYKYARVINLTDVCNPKSGKLRKDKCEKQSIFNDHKQLRQHFKRGVPVLVAWGAKKILSDLASKALKFIKDEEIYAAPKIGNPIVYYHPLCRKKDGWLSLVTKVSLTQLDNA